MPTVKDLSVVQGAAHGNVSVVNKGWALVELHEHIL
jgi:hypothetical protein